MKIWISIVSISLLCSALWADTTMIGRFTTAGGQDLGLCTKYGEVWGFGLDQDHPIVEVGKVVPVGTAYLGGYLSYWSGSKKLYAELFGVYSKDFGKLRFKAKGFAYLPLNGGKIALGSDEISLAYKVGKNVRLGGLVHLWKTDGEAVLTAAGFQMECNLGKKTSLTLRHTQGDLGQTRLFISQTF